MKTKPNRPTVKNQSFYTTFTKWTYTVRGFFGETGIEYETYKEAVKNNPKNSLICVANNEYGGACSYDDCIVKS